MDHATIHALSLKKGTKFSLQTLITENRIPSENYNTQLTKTLYSYIEFTGGINYFIVHLEIIRIIFFDLINQEAIIRQLSFLTSSLLL